MRDWLSHLNDNEVDPLLLEFIDYLDRVAQTVGVNDPNPIIAKHGREQYDHALQDIDYELHLRLPRKKKWWIF